MNKAQKTEIANALVSYYKDKSQEAISNGGKFSQRELSSKIGISPSYITYIFNRDFDKKTEAGSIILTEVILNKVASFLGLFNEVWQTKNLLKMMSACIDAKKHQEQIIVDGEKGCGKTFSANYFLKKYPKNTFLVTCASDMNPKQFMYAMGKAVGLDNSNLGGSRLELRVKIGERLIGLTDTLLIIDETENATNSVIGSLKDLYDYKDLFSKVGIVIIGANNFYETLELKSRRKNQHSYPQFLSRFGANPVYMDGYEAKVAKKIVAEYPQLNDEEVANWIVSHASDYRQLDKLIKRKLSDISLFNKKVA